jgi:hypothetical protein
MKHIQLSHVGPPISEQDLADLEGHVGGSICPEYKSFLLDRNGGACRPAVSSTLFECPLQVFFSLKSEAIERGLKVEFDVFNEYRRRHRLLPIAMTSGEEFVCLEIGVATPRVFLFSRGAERVCVDAGVILFSHDSERVCADCWASFEQSLSQPAEPPRPFLEGIAKQPWEAVRQYIDSGGETVPSEGLSLLSQAVRIGNAELFKKLIEVKAGWGDMDRAVQVAVLNNRLDFLKQLIEAGGDAALAAKLAVGPDRAAMRAYLKDVLRQ